ncbi:hypothetical protein [Candidatus Nesciobacter abundans]|uniref:Uncharacterized protein n=1 Tax=Candidatus Nesciobacter abundans TaxID=2601668 RepID=A0A5C0UHI9_9PROT|nr:hypothetical protein [Candidatus Nesciobacter abundans]QEK39161.1 hypothetical protein FZC36_01795 [Candidatus Nesciobacter abundans]
MYVFYRGTHFNTNVTDNDINRIVNDSKKRNLHGIDCTSKYSAENKLDESACEQLSNDFAELSYKGSIKFQTGKSKSTNKDFRSPMHAVQEMHVQNCDLFQEKLKDRTSELSKMLLETTGEYIDKKFLISTSLNPYVALKFCTGRAGCPEGQVRKPEKVNNELFINPLLGYLDIFVVPLDEIKSLNPFFVTEEFSTLGITLFNGASNPRHEQEEVTFPFHIPGKYHKLRYFLDVSKEPSFNKVENCAFKTFNKGNENPNRLTPIAQNIETMVSGFLLKNKFVQTFSGPTLQMLNKVEHFTPSDLKLFRKAVEEARIVLIAPHHGSESNNNKSSLINLFNPSNYIKPHHGSSNSQEHCFHVNLKKVFKENYDPSQSLQTDMFIKFQAIKYLGDFWDYNKNAPLHGHFNLHIDLSDFCLNSPEKRKLIPIILSAKNVKAIKILGMDELIYWGNIDRRGIEGSLDIEGKKRFCEEKLFPWKKLKDFPEIIKLLEFVGTSIHPKATFTLDLTGNSFSEDESHRAFEIIDNHKPGSYIEIIDENLDANQAEEFEFEEMKERLQELIEEEEEESEPSETYSEYLERRSRCTDSESNQCTSIDESSLDQTKSDFSEYEEEIEEEEESEIVSESGEENSDLDERSSGYTDSESDDTKGSGNGSDSSNPSYGHDSSESGNANNCSK